MFSRYRGITMILVLTLLFAGCDSLGNGEWEAGPVVGVAGLAEVALITTSDGTVKVSGSFSYPLVKAGPLYMNWYQGVEYTLREAKKTQYMLYIVYKDQEGGVYQEVYDIGRPFKVTFSEEQHVNVIETTGSGSIVVTVEILPPAGSAPNHGGAAPTSCPGAVSQKLKVGGQAYVCTKRDRLIIRTGPGRQYSEITRIYPGTVVDVIGGPSCASGFSYWKVRLGNGQIGWAAEGGDSIDPRFLCRKK